MLTCFQCESTNSCRLYRRLHASFDPLSRSPLFFTRSPVLRSQLALSVTLSRTFCRFLQPLQPTSTERNATNFQLPDSFAH